MTATRTGARYDTTRHEPNAADLESGKMSSVKRALVCGGSGFIGGHVVRRLVDRGYWVRAADVAERAYGASLAHEDSLADLRNPDDCERVLKGGFDEVYQLAADMGGMEFISSEECELMRSNVLINANMIDAATRAGVGRYFYSSSVCVYRDMVPGEPPLTEDDAYPALPNNEYGWEKLYSERLLLAHSRRFGLDARIARFQNCYGPEGAWQGNRAKAPAAICRKVAEAADDDTIDVFGGGETIRQFVYIEDLVDGIVTLMGSNERQPVNIGSDEHVTIRQLVETVAAVADKNIGIRAVAGPLGVQSRNFSHDRISALGWKPSHTLRDGIAHTYAWVATQVAAAERESRPT
jgi:nucleoside-diphosphate-sugar epimerase